MRWTKINSDSYYCIGCGETHKYVPKYYYLIDIVRVSKRTKLCNANAPFCKKHFLLMFNLGVCYTYDPRLMYLMDNTYRVCA